jgi:GTP cyclohydrolase I
MTKTLTLTWADIEKEVDALCGRIKNRVDAVYGIPTGGAVVAALVAKRLGVPLKDEPTGPAVLVVDDLVDTGKTMARVRPAGGEFTDALFRKPWSPKNLAPNAREVEDWLAFPWEKDDGDPVDAVIRLLQHVGEDPTRDGLLETPRRVTKAWRELTKGYALDAGEILSKTFDVTYDQLVVVRDVPFTSLCEHHILPFTGTATVGYVPGKRVVGLSKLARLVDMYASRLQVQERMTNEIADAMMQHLSPRGVGVMVKASHSCMAARGIRKHGEMVTSSLHGVIREDSVARAEFLDLARK